MKMSKTEKGSRKRVLIASANPLFAQGLQKLYGEKWGPEAVEFSLAGSMGETLTRLESWQPDLVIVDYDDRTIHREEFLSHFISGDRNMQVMLVSLQASGAVVVYDRRTLTPAQAEDWLSLPAQGAQGAQGAPGAQSPEISTTPIPRSGHMKHFFIVGALVIASTVLISLLFGLIGLLPDQASTQAVTIDRLFNAHFIIIAFLFSLITVFVVYSIVVFRSKPGQKQEGAYFKGSTGLEVVWTLIPLITVVGFSYWGAQNLAEVRREDPQALNVRVVGYQWAWLFEYPDYGVSSTTLYLPVDRQVLFSMTSRDVIHSFWVPEFRVKQDVLPGENLVKELRVTPNKIGTYQVMCAELCGGAHAYMTSPVMVVSQADFGQWLAEQVNTSEPDPAKRGEKWATANCISCHSLDGSKIVGPTWKGLFGSQVELEDGTTVTVDDAYLLQSILEPNEQIHKGYPANVMPPTYKDLLSEEQIQDILAFIQTVK
jgi:cytochrome c oxidase subunit II